MTVAARSLRQCNKLNLVADEADGLLFRLCLALRLHCGDADREDPCATRAMAPVPARLNLQSRGAIAARASVKAAVRDRSGRAAHGPPARAGVEVAGGLSGAFVAAVTRVLLDRPATARQSH